MNTLFNRWIMAATGLHITPDKQAQVDAALRELAAGQQIPVERSLHLLMEGDMLRDEFIDHITTPESYFLRHKQIMAYVVNRIIPKFLQEGKRVRVLCLPCARGEEPYTLAMMLRDRGINPRTVEIIGGDISKKRIEEARAAAYSSYSLRTVPADFQHRHFIAAAHNKFQVKQDLIGSVRFIQLNLLQDALLKVTRGFDIFFCHNLFIYFNKQTIQKALAVVWELLAPHGWFFVDTTEIPHVSGTFQRVAAGEGFGFRKGKVLQKPMPTKKHIIPPRPRPWPGQPANSRTAILPQKISRPAKKAEPALKFSPDRQEHGADLCRQAEASYRAKELDRARHLFEKLLEEEQWRCKAQLGLAMLCSDRGEQIEAIEHAEAVLNAATKERDRLTRAELAETHAIVAVSLFNKGLNDHAEHYFEELRKLAPQHQALRLLKKGK